MYKERITITRDSANTGQGQQSEDVLWTPDSGATAPLPVWAGQADVQEKPSTLGLQPAGTPDTDHDAVAYIRNWKQAIFQLQHLDHVHIDWMNQHESEATIVGLRYTDGAILLKYLGQPVRKTLILDGSWKVGDPNVRVG